MRSEKVMEADKRFEFHFCCSTKFVHFSNLAVRFNFRMEQSLPPPIKSIQLEPLIQPEPPLAFKSLVESPPAQLKKSEPPNGNNSRGNGNDAHSEIVGLNGSRSKTWTNKTQKKSAVEEPSGESDSSVSLDFKF